MLRSRRVFPHSRGASLVAVMVAAAFLCLLPFAGALEVHHVFGDLDHDGHEHSDFDLCQWVQAHGNGSADFGHQDVAAPLCVRRGQWHSPHVVASSIDLAFHESRGPPLVF